MVNEFFLVCAFLSSALALHAAVQQKDSMTYCIVLDADASGTISYENALVSLNIIDGCFFYSAFFRMKQKPTTSP